MNKVMDDKLLKILNRLSIKYEIIQHKPVLTCEEHSNALSHISTNTLLCKNMLLKSTNKDSKSFLFITKNENTINFKDLGIMLGTKNLRLLKDKTLMDRLNIKKGNVTPFSIINDNSCTVNVILDKRIISTNKKLGFHSSSNEKTILISSSDLLKFLRQNKHEPKIINIDLKSKINSNSIVKKDEKGINHKKEENFSKWYSEIVVKSEMIEYYDISGCYILRPSSCFIWNKIREFFTKEIEKLGVEEAYFPMFVTKTALEAEANHINGFQPEVAWVTKSGKSEMNIPIAIRPTSETIMYPAYKNWIRSHRDLPVRLNQWVNVVRWEFKNPTPFIRTREFLWQEGHSAFATKEEADKEVTEILNLYSRIYEELLAVPVIKGIKTNIEKFPGGDYTTTVETFIPNSGRSIQGGTSHGLGQNFGKIFSIEFEDENKNKKIPYQNSWGFTTRSIGVMIMIHGDNKGLIIPPKVSQWQVVIIPIIKKFKNKSEEKEFINSYTNIYKIINNIGVRVHIDDRTNYNPGWKYNYWELKGVPIRLEFGPKDKALNSCIIVRRDTGNKSKCSIENLSTDIPETLTLIQDNLFNKAKERIYEKKKIAYNWKEFIEHINNLCFVEVPFCETDECEEMIKNKTNDKDNLSEKNLTGSAKSLCIPYEQSILKKEDKCFACEKKAKRWTLFGRSY